MLQREVFAFQPGVCCADQETCAMPPLSSCDCLASYWDMWYQAVVALGDLWFPLLTL